MNVKRASLVGAYLATVPTANLAISAYGLVPVGFGLTAPAGVYLAGASFVLRDLVRESFGNKTALAVVILGSFVSYVISDPMIAVASAAAFLTSELFDAAVYEPIRSRTPIRAAFVSNTVGAVVDSCIFLGLAFGSLELVPGQVVGKLWATVIGVSVLTALRFKGGRSL